ncbi:tyrosine-type recombinase/integrase [Rikenellaceae bacterium DSM 108975]|nr:tyrosine-type recombinase/integrase [Gallalistipes aquisgranensis]
MPVISNQKCNEYLKEIADVCGIKKHLKFHCSRHTWTMIAAELEIPKETIAATLGHGGNEVTDIYIRFDQKKVDRAIR